MSKDMILPLVTTAFLVLGAILGSYVTWNFRAQSKEKQNEIQDLSKENRDLINNNLELSQTILGITERIDTITDSLNSISLEVNSIVKRNNQNTLDLREISNSIKNYQTGGDSYPLYVFAPSSLESRPNLVRIGVKIVGENPLAIRSHNVINLSLLVEVELDPLEQITRERFNERQSRSQAIFNSMPFLHPGIYNSGDIIFGLAEYALPDERETFVFALQTFASNGEYMQNLIIQKAEPYGYITTAYRVSKVLDKGGREVLEEYGDLSIVDNAGEWNTGF